MKTILGWTAAALLLVGFPVSVSASYSASPSSTTTGGGTWGSILRLAASISGTQATFTVSKQSGMFTSAGTMYLREGSDTGTTRGSTAVSAGASSATISLNLSSVSGYPKSFYARYESSAGGYAWVGPITVSLINQAPGVPTISNSPASIRVNTSVNISVTRGTDSDGDQVKVRCTATNSNRTDASPYDSGFGTGGTSVTASFTFSATGTQTIWCASFDALGAGGTTSQRTISVTANQAPTTPIISSSPASAQVGESVSVSVTRGTDPDGDQVKVRCTAQDSNRTDASPYDSGLGTGGTSITASFIFNTAGTKTIWCASFDALGAGGTTSQRTISITANQPPTTPTISSSPATAYRGVSVDVAVTRGTDPNGDTVKVQCTAIDSNRTDASPYISSFASGGTATTASFTFNLAGSKTIYCASFDGSGAVSPTQSRTIQVNEPTPTGSLTSPTGSVTGPVTLTATVNAPLGLQKVSVNFVPNQPSYALCENGTATPCPATTGSWNQAGVDPRWYSASAGALTLGLWVRDATGTSTLVSQRSITWQPASTGAITAPSGSGAGVITVTANATAPAGLKKVSVVFVPNGTPLVLCEDGTAVPCPASASGSWSKADVNPRDYSVPGSAPLVLGLWVLDDLGRVENVAQQAFQWDPVGSGAFSSPSGSVTGPVRITANASASQGLKKVSVVFVEGGPSFVLCEDGTASPCPAATSGTWDRSGIDPRAYGVQGAGTVTLGLWIRDDLSRTDLVKKQSFTWAPLTAPVYLNVSDWAQAAADYLVTHWIVDDTPNHDLRGTSDANRAEVAVMIYRSLGGGKASADANFASWYGGAPTPRFIDVVDPTVWYFKAASYLGGLEFGDGITVFDQQIGIFRPANSISKAWAVKALLEAWDIPPLTSFSGVTLFADVPTSHPAAGYIYQAQQKGIVTGTNNLFQPDVAADRQDLFVMLHRLLDAQANANLLAIASPAPLSRDDFAAVRPPRRIGLRYEQPVLSGVQAPTVSLTATPLTRETVGSLAGIFTSTLDATLSGIDGRTFVDSSGVSHTAHPFCAWSADSGSFIDLTPALAIPFSRVRWLAPADVSAASGSAAAFEITVFCGDDLGNEVHTSLTLSLSSPSNDATLPTVTLSPLPTGKIAGQVADLDGTAQDGGDVNAADYGILRVELFSSTDGSVTWVPLGEAPLDAQGTWHFQWLLPAFSGTIQVKVEATNLRGNSVQAQRSMSVLPALSIGGSVVDGAGLPLENAVVTVSGGSLSATVAADGNGVFSFSNATGTALQTGVSYTLSTSFMGRSATVSGLTLSSQSQTLNQVLTLDLAPPITAASVPGGTYGAPQSVELVCVDDHSGCSATYYTVDGTAPGFTSARYTAPIPVTHTTTLQFFSADGAGNLEAAVTESYIFEACSFTIDPLGAGFDGTGGAGSVAVTAPGGCPWTAASDQDWIVVTDGASGTGNGTVTFAVAANPTTSPRTGTLTIAGRTFTVSQAAAIPLPGLDFYTIAPCRLLDTRATAPMASGISETLTVNGACGIPASAKALAVNVTVVGASAGGYITIWPSDMPKPVTSAVNFEAQSARANNGILPLATDGSGRITVEALVGNGGTVHLIVDVSGYFE